MCRTNADAPAELNGGTRQRALICPGRSFCIIEFLTVSRQERRERIKRFVFYPDARGIKSRASASCTTCLLCNLIKELFLHTPLLRESGCKGNANILHTQEFQEKSLKKYWGTGGKLMWVNDRRSGVAPDNNDLPFASGKTSMV